MPDKIESYIPVFVEQMPTEKEDGKLYISHKYGISIHLCACGCGGQSVLGLKPKWSDGWELIECDGYMTFTPSILNRLCNAHYYIENNSVRWC